ncbi:MAG: F0F1 ATP synthase subunit epsilon [Acholeplasmatales bacterium]|nr:F0F1 ATP synthase subunit epsilon [Acholeplasmatales bacterium]
MKVVVSTHQGVLYDEEVEYFVVHDQEDGEYAVLKDHVPVISVLEFGYVKLVDGKNEIYISIISGIVEFHDNVATILVQEAQSGSSLESAKRNLEAARKERLERNRQETTDFTQKERELREHIKNSGAGQL